MSSPMALAGQKPHTAAALNQRWSTICFSIFSASANSERAASPTILSSRIAGYFPANSQVEKNGDQSMVAISSSIE